MHLLIVGFLNLRPISTIFSILVDNDAVDKSYDFGCYGNHLWEKLRVSIMTKIGMSLNWLVQGEYRVYTTV